MRKQQVHWKASSSVSCKNISPDRAEPAATMVRCLISVLLARRGRVRTRISPPLSPARSFSQTRGARFTPASPFDDARRNPAVVPWNYYSRVPLFPRSSQEEAMNGLIYLIGLIVVILAILSFFGLR
jgi:hypothetical protein